MRSSEWDINLHVAGIARRLLRVVKPDPARDGLDSLLVFYNGLRHVRGSAGLAFKSRINTLYFPRTSLNPKTFSRINSVKVEIKAETVTDAHLPASDRWTYRIFRPVCCLLCLLNMKRDRKSGKSRDCAQLRFICDVCPETVHSFVCLLLFVAEYDGDLLIR